MLAPRADWARVGALGKIVGYYGYNTLTGVPPDNRSHAQEFTRHVDAFFPSTYTLDNNCAADLTALTLTMMGRLPKVVPTIKM